MGIKGCWTCRERKVRCDSHWPKCNNCTKARRMCQGYGIQLSWPRESDKKRAIISRDASAAMKTSRSNVKSFLNSYSWDVSLSEDLGNGNISARCIRNMRIPRPTYLSATAISNEESHLLEFFNESRSLLRGPTDEVVLTRFILRIAFSDPSDVSNPVLQSVFALASLQLHGSSKSTRYKHLVVTSVGQSTDWLDGKTLLQNLMAMMLLYHHELSLESTSKGSWGKYLCAVAQIINTSPAVHKLIRQEYSVFLDWIYYHEVLAEFTARHWHVPYEGNCWTPTARSPVAIEDRESDVGVCIGCPTDVLELIVHTCRQAIVGNSSEAGYLYPEMERIKVLEQNISKVVGDYGPVHIQSAIPMDRNTMLSDLHRLACLIYVNRTVNCVSGTEFHHRRLVSEGVLLLTKLITCQSAWPLFIIACEAVDDDQRLAILDVFQKTRQDQRRRSSHIHLIEHTVMAMWSQHDLNMENRVDYLSMFDAVLHGVPFLPPFA